MARLKTDAELEYESKYGSKSDHEMNQIVRKSLSSKLDAYFSGAFNQDKYKNLSYMEMVKGVRKSAKAVDTLKAQREKLLSDKRKEFEEECADQIKRGAQIPVPEYWISQKLTEFMGSGEYMDLKREIAHAEYEVSQYSREKAIWEQDNADIITEAQTRTRRSELFEADDEALRELGIDPATIREPKHTDKDKTDGKELYRNALKSLHPSDTDAEIEQRLNLV